MYKPIYVHNHHSFINFFDLSYRNDFQEEKVTAKKTTPTAQQLQSVPEVDALLTLVKDESAGEVTLRPQRSRAGKFTLHKFWTLDTTTAAWCSYMQK